MGLVANGAWAGRPATRADVLALAERMLFMTGGATPDAAAPFLHEMAGREISKPFDRSRLLAALEHLVGGPSDDAA